MFHQFLRSIFWLLRMGCDCSVENVLVAVKAISKLIIIWHSGYSRDRSVPSKWFGLVGWLDRWITTMWTKHSAYTSHHFVHNVCDCTKYGIHDAFLPLHFRLLFRRLFYFATLFVGSRSMDRFVPNPTQPQFFHTQPIDGIRISSQLMRSYVYTKRLSTFTFPPPPHPFLRVRAFVRFKFQYKI